MVLVGHRYYIYCNLSLIISLGGALVAHVAGSNRVKLDGLMVIDGMVVIDLCDNQSLKVKL